MVFLKSDIAKLLYIYTLSHILILLNFQGLYWDDWVIFGASSETLHHLFDMSGAPYVRPDVHEFLLSIGNKVFSYRLLVFVSFFASGAFLYAFLKDFVFKSGSSALIISAIYLTIPLNNVKLALINSPSVLFMGLFFFAFYLLSQYMVGKHGLWKRTLIWLLFFVSFFLNSLLVFYAIVVCYIVYVVYFLNEEERYLNKVLSSVKIVLLKYLDFISLPVVFYVFKQNFMVPHGLYASYNKISLDLGKASRVIDLSIDTSIITPFKLAVEMSVVYWPAFLVVMFVMVTLLRKEVFPKYKLSYYPVIFGLGVAFYVLAIFPYAAVGKLPQLVGWESRHQILMPLGIAFMSFPVVGLIGYINQKLVMVMFSILLSIFTVQNINNNFAFIKDWYYQVALAENYKASELVKNHSTIVNKVMLPGALVNRRGISYYEQNGRLKRIFGDDKRLMVGREAEINRWKGYRVHKQYNFYSWEYAPPIFFTSTKNSSIKNVDSYILKMLFFQFLDKNKFKAMAKDLIVFQQGK